MELSPDGLTLLRVDNNDINNGKFMIPNTVTHIGREAFLNCNALTEIVIPNSITHIDKGAFACCEGLTEIVIPNSITHIDEAVFFECRYLKNLILPNSITHIGDQAFYGCTHLDNLILPDSITYIGEEAFNWCRLVCYQLIIPKSVTHIGDRAFSLGDYHQVIIPNALTHLGWNVFGLKDILIDASDENEYQRILNFFPSDHHWHIFPFDLYQEIKKAKDWELNSVRVFDTYSPLKDLPNELSNLIHQYDERLHKILDNILPPHHKDELQVYKEALQKAHIQFRK